MGVSVEEDLALPHHYDYYLLHIKRHVIISATTTNAQ